MGTHLVKVQGGTNGNQVFLVLIIAGLTVHRVHLLVCLAGGSEGQFGRMGELFA